MSNSDQVIPEVQSITHRFVEAIQSAQQTESDSLDSLVFAAMEQLLERLSALDVWGEENRLPSSELWRIAGNLLSVGSLQLRARTKPRGYAGDFEMLDQICATQCCDDPLGEFFDKFFQSQHAPSAVRARTNRMTREIVGQSSHIDGPFHVTSIGSGPAVEIVQALEQIPVAKQSQLRVTLLDLDPSALEFAEAGIRSQEFSGQLQCVRENLFRLPTRKSAAIEDADLIYCMGFFDYLNDQDAASMLQMMSHALSANGQLFVFNFAPSNPTRAYMEWIGNWYLTYRDNQAMTRLAESAGLEDRFEIDSESQGIDLFIRAWHATKPATKLRR